MISSIMPSTQDKKFTKELSDAGKLMATKCLKMVVRDLDSVPILDYLGNVFLQSINENSEQAKKFEEVFNQAFQFVESEYKKKKTSR